MSSCFGNRKRGNLDPEEEPLLSERRDDTKLQRRLRQKLQTYQIFLATSKGYMPSTQQITIYLRALLASDALNPSPSSISASSLRLLKFTKRLIHQVIELLQKKNGEDQLQDIIWVLKHIDFSRAAFKVTQGSQIAKSRANYHAAYGSVQTLGNLFLSNAEFRTFLSDLKLLGRELVKDSAFIFSNAAKDAGDELEKDKPPGPTTSQSSTLVKPKDVPNASDPDIGVEAGQASEAKKVTRVLREEATRVEEEVTESARARVAGPEGEVLARRLRTSIAELRNRTDYVQSVSTLSLLFRRFASEYARVFKDDALRQASAGAQNTEDSDISRMKRILDDAWLFISSFGDFGEWESLAECWRRLFREHHEGKDVEQALKAVADNLQLILTDTSYLDNPEKAFDQLREKVHIESPSLRKDLGDVLTQVRRTFNSVLQDSDMISLSNYTAEIVRTIFPDGISSIDTNILQDILNVFLPLIVASIQYLPIPRLELSTPDVDLLVESLILEPGSTVNRSSFFPFRLGFETLNNFEVRKSPQLQVVSKVDTRLTFKIEGVSMRAEEFGFWLRLHSGPLLRLADEGIATFELDERGIDVVMEVELLRNDVENVLVLRKARAHVHKLSYSIRQSKFACLLWLVKPFLRPILRKVIEKKIVESLGQMFHGLNRELVFARERLRAARISDPDDISKFFRAVTSRFWPPEENPDVHVAVKASAKSSTNVFHNVFAPGSTIKVWHEDAEGAGELVEEFERGGWRNHVFDLYSNVDD